MKGKVGFIAEDVEQVEPRLVAYSKEGRVDSLHYERFTVLLVKAVQELKSENNFLKQQNAEILERLEALESQ